MTWGGALVVCLGFGPLLGKGLEGKREALVVEGNLGSFGVEGTEKGLVFICIIDAVLRVEGEVKVDRRGGGRKMLGEAGFEAIGTLEVTQEGGVFGCPRGGGEWGVGAFKTTEGDATGPIPNSEGNKEGEQEGEEGHGVRAFQKRLTRPR